MDDLEDMRLDQLTAEMAWIRRLAHALVKDASTADDVAQDTWLAAAGKVPGDRPIRPWLSRVVLNLVRMRSRSERRRNAREEAAPVADDVPTADELVDRVELQRAVVDEVLALPEPYRSTVLLHFFEGMTSADIARRLGIPDGTVRRRLKTALDQLRERLRARYDRRGGLLALAPIAALRPGDPVLLGMGDLTMKKLLAVLVLLALVVGGVVLWRSRGGGKDAASKAAPIGTGAGGGTVAAQGSNAPGDALAVKPWFVQPGTALRHIAGKVTSKGEPVAGATVRLGAGVTDPPDPFRDRSGDELATKVTGADGAFDFGMQPATTFIVSGEAAEKTPASVMIAAADPAAKTDQIKLELGGCRSRIFGQVVDASGGGIAAARLRVVGLGGATANQSGEYSLCVPAGDSQVRIDADGYGAIDRPLHLVGEIRQNFELVPEAVIAGTVVDENGAAVAFARVIALPQPIEAPHFLGDGHATADADGKFRLTNLAPGRFLLAASADGYGTSAVRPAVAAPGSGNQDVTIVVAHRARIRGHVVAGGKPVAGARMSIAGHDLSGRASYSQPDGAFVLDNVPLGKQTLLAGVYEVLSPKALDVKAGSMDDLTVEVAEMASLHGKIVRHGKPVPDAVVQTSLGQITNSDASGRYELRGLPAGEMQVTVQAYGNINAFSPFKTVKIVAGQSTEYDIDLVGGASVRGTVVDAAGAPVPNVYVRMIEPHGDLGESMTDASGVFVATAMLGGGDYRVAVFPTPGARVAFQPANGAQTEIKVPDGEAAIDNITIAIEHDNLSIAGRITDDTGAAVADVHIEAIGGANNGFGNAMLPSIRADATGHFEIPDLAPGTYTLHAHAGDGSEGELRDVAAGAKDTQVRLIRPGAIDGTIAGFASIPRVHARQLTAELALDNDAILDGNAFTITGLAPGKYVVEALAGDESAGQSVVVTSGQTTHVKLESKGQGFVEGTVTDFTSKQPIAGFSCFAAQSMGGQAGDATVGPATPENTTTAAGTFRIHAPIGKARVVCFYPDATYSVAGGDADVTAALAGHVELKAVKADPPPSNPGFRIKGLTLPLVIATVDANGPAKAAGLAMGDRVVSIDGAPVTGLLPGAAMMLVWNHKPGSTLVMGVDRGGTPVSVKIVPLKATN